jgi:histidinol phosphatase-like enzyme (inositol monophosphatase family)
MTSAKNLERGRYDRPEKGMIDSSELKTLLDFAVHIGREAGAITLRHFKGSIQPERKSDNSFVTIADRETEDYLRSKLEHEFPADGILGEEFGEKTGSSPRRWIVDPIDGTYSFVHGVPLYTVLIGLEVDSESVLGVVNVPVLDEMVYAAQGVGCFWNGKPARASSTRNPAEALLLATDVSADDKSGFAPAILRLQKRFGGRRTWGDAYGHILVATGRAEVMLDPIMNVWDCAALLPILKEAGGTFTDWKGQWTIHGGNAISTNGLLFQEVMQIINADNPRN